MIIWGRVIKGRTWGAGCPLVTFVGLSDKQAQRYIEWVKLLGLFCAYDHDVLDVWQAY
jgi:hypothetical protein